MQPSGGGCRWGYFPLAVELSLKESSGEGLSLSERRGGKELSVPSGGMRSVENIHSKAWNPPIGSWETPFSSRMAAFPRVPVLLLRQELAEIFNVPQVAVE